VGKNLDSQLRKRES